MPSVKKNIILNGVNTVTSILFPIITFPYAARILLPEGIGVINFLNSIIGYIVLFTSLGIPLYAVKEVAKYQKEPDKRNQLTIEIIILSFGLCLLGYIAVWLLATFIPQIHANLSIFYILSLSILFTAIGVDWFYKGIEDFKFITYRALIIRIIAAASLFIFVHNDSDLVAYAFVIVGSTVGNNLINFIHLRKYISLKTIKIKKSNISRHIKPTLQIFILNLIISLYIQLNSIMLGFMAGDEPVGYYTAGTRISHIGLTLISSIGVVLLPRCSHLIHSGDTESFRNIIQKSLRIIQLLAYPMTVGLMILVVPITIIFCGNEYFDAIPVALINAPVLILISYTNLMGIQILYPMDKIKLIIYSVTCGAIFNILLNLILIPDLHAIGAAIGAVIAELSVMIIQIILGRKYFPFKISMLFNLRYFLSSITMGIIALVATIWLHTYWIMLAIGIPISILIYGMLLYLQKDKILDEIIQFLIKRPLRNVKA